MSIHSDFDRAALLITDDVPPGSLVEVGAGAQWPRIIKIPKIGKYRFEFIECADTGQLAQVGGIEARVYLQRGINMNQKAIDSLFDGPSTRAWRNTAWEERELKDKTKP